MEEQITEEEVCSIIKEMKGNRAPGPDGFTGTFYKQCWATIKYDLLAALRAVHANETTHLHRLNQATMVLLPKNPEVLHPKDYRPINLICSFAKLVTKILAAQFQRRMPELVKPCQNAFIRGRVIHNSFSYVSGLARAFRRSKSPRH